MKINNYRTSTISEPSLRRRPGYANKILISLDIVAIVPVPVCADTALFWGTGFLYYCNDSCHVTSLCRVPAGACITSSSSTHRCRRCRRAQPRRPTRCRSRAPPPATTSGPAQLGSRSIAGHRCTVCLTSPHSSLRAIDLDYAFFRDLEIMFVKYGQCRDRIARRDPAIVPLLCSRGAGGHFLVAVCRRDLRGSQPAACRSPPTPTFSETFSSFKECVRSL